MIKKIANQVMIALAVLLIVWLIVDEYHSAMGFLTSDISKIYIAVFCVLAIFIGYINIVDNYKRMVARRRAKKREPNDSIKTED